MGAIRSWFTLRRTSLPRRSPCGCEAVKGSLPLIPSQATQIRKLSGQSPVGSLGENHLSSPLPDLVTFWFPIS